MDEAERSAECTVDEPELVRWEGSYMDEPATEGLREKVLPRPMVAGKRM